jgi:tetratricopeptide (TPR) repeat protein
MGHRCSMRRWVLGALFVAGCAASASAQGRVAGVVRDEGGQPIKGATLTFQNADASPNAFTSTSDDKGRFSVIGLRSGEWSVVVQAPGYDPQMGGLNVRQSTPAALAFTLKHAPAPPPSALGGIAAKDIQSELRAADQLYNAEQWDQAIAAYKALLTRAPALSVISLQIGAAYRNKKDWDNALAAYNDLLKVDPNSDKAKIGVALTNMEKGDLDAARTTLVKASESPTAGKEVFYNLGEVEFAKGAVDEAMKWYQRASNEDPSWGKPLLKLGLCSLNKGDKASAAKMMERVLTVDPSSVEAVQAKNALDQMQKS